MSGPIKKSWIDFGPHDTVDAADVAIRRLVILDLILFKVTGEGNETDILNQYGLVI